MAASLFPAVVLVVAIAVLVQRKPLQAQVRRPVVWEYKVISINHPTQMEAKLQTPGADGWECVGFNITSSDGHISGAYALLKRQK
jgi:hypothetical protein